VLKVYDATGAQQNFDFFQDGSSNYVFLNGLCGLTCTNQMDVNSSHQALVLEANSAALLTAVQASIPAGSALIGGVELYDTGGTNKASINASGQLAIVATALPLPTAAATSANQATEISSLATIASNTGAALPAGTALIGGTYLVDSAGTNKAAVSAAGAVSVSPVTSDPCTSGKKTTIGFSGSSAEFIAVANTSGKTTYICAFNYRMGGTAGTHVSVVAGHGTTCQSGTESAALSGSTTAANGLAEAQYGGEAYGSGGGTIMAATTASDDVCILQDSTALIAGSVSYVQQ
jgi:hypothetical protein